jgi:cholesterol transport system auxiliary component
MRLVSWFAAAVLLVGCVTSHQLSKQQYDLGDFAVFPHGSSVLAVNVVIRDVSQPSWLRSRNIFYRFDYAAPSRRHYYAMSEWVASSGELITVRLREAVASANAGFTLPTSTGAGGYVLQANLEEFTQAFTAPAQSQCIVQLRATLWRTVDQIVAQRVFRIEIPAQTPDASGAVRCLAAAANREAEDIIEWLSKQVVTARSGDASVS